MNGNQQPNQHPSQPIEVQPDGTWILGRGADRWTPSENQIGDLRWVVERDLRQELGVPPKTALNKDKIEFHKRQLALLDLAKQAPRCEHVFSDGRCCKAPRVKKGKLCYAHTLMEEKRPQELNLPPLEDANAVMLWLMDALRGLLEGRITERTAGLMFYGLQLAMVNARFTTFRDTNHTEMVRKAPRHRRGRRNRASSPTSEGRALPERNTGDFTAKGAEIAKKKEQRELATPRAGENALPQWTQRNTEEEAAGNVTVENAEIANGEKVEKTTTSRIDDRLEPQKAEGIPGVESAKSIFFGVEPGEGVADNRPVLPPPEPPRKKQPERDPGDPQGRRAPLEEAKTRRKRYLFHPGTYLCLIWCKGKETCGSTIDNGGFDVSGDGRERPEPSHQAGLPAAQRHSSR